MAAGIPALSLEIQEFRRKFAGVAGNLAHSQAIESGPDSAFFV